MLKNLSIKNVALIRQADIEFGNGLNVLSGETGAGKSVVLEALNFVLGQKADKSMICYGEKECSVSCCFDITDNIAVKEVLEDIGVDIDDLIIIKRTLNTDGKSTIKLNGDNVTAAMLRRVTTLLVDVHGQSDHFILLKEANQLALIDALGGNKIDSIKSEIDNKIIIVKDIDEKLAGLFGDETTRARRIDYLQYAIQEIEKAELKPDEEEQLIIRKKRMINLEKILVATSESSEIISGEGGVIDLLSAVSKKISGITQYDNQYENLYTRIDAVLEEISDISSVISDDVDEDFSEEELDRIETRLNVINSLKKKYGNTYNDIIATRNKFDEELEFITAASEQIEKLNNKRVSVIKELDTLYDLLTRERIIISKNLSSSLSLKLKELAMKGAGFAVEFSKQEGEVLSVKGRDSVCFMFTANKGEIMKPLSKVISGGELSRLMLGIKAVIGGSFSAETFIFDEIDVGISGEAALVVAKNFASISLNRQIIAISHLPQIVSMADISFLICKREEGERTVTSVQKLDDKGKVKEVVRLIGGITYSEAAINHAKEMINNCNEYKRLLN